MIYMLDILCQMNVMDIYSKGDFFPQIYLLAMNCKIKSQITHLNMKRHSMFYFWECS